MIAKGTFEVDLTPISEDSHPAGRMTIDKVYSGDFVGKGVGQMLSKRTEAGESAYCAMKRSKAYLTENLEDLRLYTTESCLQILHH